MVDKYMYLSPKYCINPLDGFRENGFIDGRRRTDDRQTADDGFPVMNVALES